MIEKATIARTDELARDRFIKGYAGGKNNKADVENRTVSGVASTLNVDRDGEIILPKAFEARLKIFEAGNAPFAAAHMHRTADGGPTQIGWVGSLAVSPADVRTTFRFAKTDLAEQWWKLASDPAGKGIAFSIGFIPKAYARGQVRDLVRDYAEIQEAVKRAGLDDDEVLRIYTDIELLEISAVMVPSNRESVQQLAAKFFGGGDGAEKRSDAQIDKALRDLASPIIAETVKGMEDKLSELFADVVGEIDALKSLLPGYLRDDAGECDADHTRPDRTRQAGAGVGKTSQAWQSLQATARELADAAGRRE